MGNEADERLGLCDWRNSISSRKKNGEWRMENEAAAQQFSIPHSPFPILRSPFSNLLFENYSLQLLDFALRRFLSIPIKHNTFQLDMNLWCDAI